MKIKTKLLLLAACSLAAIIITGVQSLVGTASLSGNTEQLINVIIPAQEHLNRVKFANTKIEQAVAEIAFWENDYSAKARQEFADILRRYDAGWAAAGKSRTEYYELSRSPAAVEGLKPVQARLAKAVDTWKSQIDPIRPVLERLVALPTGNTAEQSALMARVIEIFRKQIDAYEAHQDALDALIGYERKLTEQIQDHDTAMMRNFTLSQSTMFGMAIILILFISWNLTRTIMKPLTLTCGAMEHIAADNDLTHQVDLDNKDEMGQLTKSFNTLIGRLHGTLTTVSHGTDGVLTTASALAVAASQVAESSARQAGATSATMAAVEEMTVSINTVSDNAEQAQSLARMAGENSVQGGAIIQKAVCEMSEIATTVSDASRVIHDLGEDSKEISNVVQVIREVADQTNLLALNAAIEAARAGEQGRGFAVVADEVRKLAERTAQSTGDIGAMIKKIQASAGDAVTEMGKVVQRVESGRTLAESAGECMTSIQEDSAKVSEAVTEISDNLKEQSKASQDIAQNVENIARMTEENNVAADKVSSEAQQLDQLAKEASASITVFKL
jgi:methyl-accepting chemotaxis protein